MTINHLDRVAKPRITLSQNAYILHIYTLIYINGVAKMGCKFDQVYIFKSDTFFILN